MCNFKAEQEKQQKWQFTKPVFGQLCHTLSYVVHLLFEFVKVEKWVTMVIQTGI